MSPVVRSAVVYVVLFAAVGAWFPYVSVYYRHVGLSLEAVGLLTALYSAVGLVAAPAWGAIVDHLRTTRGPLAVAGAWSALAAALLLVVRDPLPGRTVGIAWAIGAAIEVPLMFLFPAIVRRVGAEWLLVIGALAFSLRSLGWALVDDPTVLLAIMLAGGVGFAFFYVGTVTYVARAVPVGVQATAQGVFSGTAFSFGSILGSVLGGVVAGASSLPALFGLSTGLLGVAAVVVWWAVVRGGPDARQTAAGRSLDSRA